MMFSETRERCVPGAASKCQCAAIPTTFETHLVPLQSSCHPLLGGIHRFAAFRALGVFHRLERHSDWRGSLSWPAKKDNTVRFVEMPIMLRVKVWCFHGFVKIMDFWKFHLAVPFSTPGLANFNPLEGHTICKNSPEGRNCIHTRMYRNLGGIELKRPLLQTRQLIEVLL